VGHSVVSSSSRDYRVGRAVDGCGGFEKGVGSERGGDSGWIEDIALFRSMCTAHKGGLRVPPNTIPLPLGACVQLRNMPKLFADVIVAQPEPPPKPLPPPKVSPREVRDERRFVTEAGLHGSTRIACGWRHCVAVNATGETCAWGSNSHGQVGWLSSRVLSPGHFNLIP
jgi:hypothetical protein